jgi:hypothetical protein
MKKIGRSAEFHRNLWVAGDGHLRLSKAAEIEHFDSNEALLRVEPSGI